MTRLYRDTISGLNGHPMSGLWMLAFESGRTAHIESGSGVRALASAFGATEGSGDLLEKITGKEIIWFEDEMGLGLMGGFDLPENYTGEPIPPEGLEVSDDA